MNFKSIPYYSISLWSSFSFSWALHKHYKVFTQKVKEMQEFKSSDKIDNAFVLPAWEIGEYV